MSPADSAMFDSLFFRLCCLWLFCYVASILVLYYTVYFAVRNALAKFADELRRIKNEDLSAGRRSPPSPFDPRFR